MENTDSVADIDNTLCLDFTTEIEDALAPLYEKVKDVVACVEWPFFAPYIYHINRLKKEKNAVILAHNYMTPDIFHCVADFVGDSLQLAVEAARCDADIIIQGGVYFMAETSKVLSPEKTILIPEEKAGCSLSSSIEASDVRALRQKYPGVPIVTYVNTSASVKAESDICCTSSNAADIVMALPTDRVILIPDQYLAQNVALQTKKQVITWAGSCVVHEQFTPAQLADYRDQYPDIHVVAHPECPPSVTQGADFVGSTSKCGDYIRDHKPETVMLLTECSMGSNLQAEHPDVNFIAPCQLCPYMKMITLPKILRCLQGGGHTIELANDVIAGARQSVQRMIDFQKEKKLSYPFVEAMV